MEVKKGRTGEFQEKVEGKCSIKQEALVYDALDFSLDSAVAQHIAPRDFVTTVNSLQSVMIQSFVVQMAGSVPSRLWLCLHEHE